MRIPCGTNDIQEKYINRLRCESIPWHDSSSAVHVALLYKEKKMGWHDNEKEFSELVGKTLVAVRHSDDEVTFVTDAGETYKLYHSQDCCESVTVESITGDLDDLIGSPILKAGVVTSGEKPADVPEPEYGYDSVTWTFYKLATIKGYVDIRWIGESNGYYSESVDFALVDSAA